MKLMNAKELLEALFSEESRPSLRWLRHQTRIKAIGSVRMGAGSRLIFYDIDAIRAAMEAKNLGRK